MDSNKTSYLEYIDTFNEIIANAEEEHKTTNNEAKLFFGKFKRMIINFSEKLCDIFIEFDQLIFDDMRKNHLKLLDDFNNFKFQLNKSREEIRISINEIKNIKNFIEEELGEDVICLIGNTFINSELSKLELPNLKNKFDNHLDNNSLLLVKCENIERAMKYHKNLLSCAPQ